VYCDWKKRFSGLPDTDGQRYTDKFKSLGVDNYSILTSYARFEEPSGQTIQLPYEKDGADNMTIEFISK